MPDRGSKIAEGRDAAPKLRDTPATRPRRARDTPATRHARDTPATRPRHARDTPATRPRPHSTPTRRGFFPFFSVFSFKTHELIRWVAGVVGQAGWVGSGGFFRGSLGIYPILYHIFRYYIGLNATARPTGSLSSQRFCPSNRVSQTMDSLSFWGPPAKQRAPRS